MTGRLVEGGNVLSFLAALSVLVFHVPMVMLSPYRIFGDAPVTYLTPPSWCTAEDAVLAEYYTEQIEATSGEDHR